MRGILAVLITRSSAEERIPLTLNNLLNADYSVPLPQGARGGSVGGARIGIVNLRADNFF